MLKRIEVRNFKSLKHVDFKCAGLNLLMGLNGAGKSSFVQLLRSLSKVADADKANSIEVKVNVPGSFMDLRYCYGNEKAPIEVAVDYTPRFPPTDEDHICTLKRMFVPGNEKNEMIMAHPKSIAAEGKALKCMGEQYGNTLGINQARDMDPALWMKQRNDIERISNEVREEKKQLEESESEAFKTYGDLWRSMKFVSSFRERPHDVYDGSRPREYRNLGAVPVSPDGRDLGEYLSKHARGDVVGSLDDMSPMLYPGSASIEQVKSEDRGHAVVHHIVKGNELGRQLQLWLNEVSPGARIFTEKIEISDDEKYIMSVGFEADKDCEHRFKPQNVGFGISYVLPVLIVLLTARAHDIVIIENPEAHLHPKGQAAMGNLIARAVASGVQVFAETHSDHVVNGIRAAVKDGIVKPSDVNIAFFERKEHDVPDEDGSSHQEIYSEVRNIRVDKNGSLSEYPDGFLDEWNNQLMELI
jgi:predicted ATPase